MVVINLRNKVIPIDFGEFQFEFSKSDENIEKMQSFAQDLQLEAQKIVDEDGKGDVTKAREILKLAYNGISPDSPLSTALIISLRLCRVLNRSKSRKKVKNCLIAILVSSHV